MPHSTPPTQGAGQGNVYYVLANPAYLDPTHPSGLPHWVELVGHTTLNLSALGMLCMLVHHGGKISRSILVGCSNREIESAIPHLSGSPLYLIREVSE